MRDCKEERDFEHVNDVVMVGKEACLNFSAFFEFSVLHCSFSSIIYGGASVWYLKNHIKDGEKVTECQKGTNLAPPNTY